jgi:CRISPR-associated protein (TIGR03984 family)
MREICACLWRIEEVEVDPGFAEDAAAWLAGQARPRGLHTLLAHADDGVIWGRLDGQKLELSSTVFGTEVSPPLRPETLQQARLFGQAGELFVWKGRDGEWQGRLLTDEIREDGDRLCFDEPQILWGDRPVGDPQGGFTLVADGQQGLCHAVPLTDIPFGKPQVRPLRLGVRHYVEVDERSSGMPRVTHSRLTGVWAEPRKEESNG